MGVTYSLILDRFDRASYARLSTEDLETLHEGLVWKYHSTHVIAWMLANRR